AKLWLGETIADNGGLKTGFRVYLEHLKKFPSQYTEEADAISHYVKESFCLDIIKQLHLLPATSTGGLLSSFGDLSEFPHFQVAPHSATPLVDAIFTASEDDADEVFAYYNRKQWSDVVTTRHIAVQFKFTNKASVNKANFGSSWGKVMKLLVANDAIVKYVVLTNASIQFSQERQVRALVEAQRLTAFCGHHYIKALVTRDCELAKAIVRPMQANLHRVMNYYDAIAPEDAPSAPAMIQDS
ncbi:hypothetical protein B5M09_012730, partial [Aphanomyces astaci]